MATITVMRASMNTMMATVTPTPTRGTPVLSIIRSAISHTVQVSVFIFLVTLILVAVLETFGESAIEQFLRGNETLAVLGSALVGLIPNCSASVVITQLYLEGALQLAPMLAGTLISAGVGYLVLFRTNRSARENVLFLIMMYVIGAGWGLILSAVRPLSGPNRTGFKIAMLGACTMWRRMAF